MSIEESLIRREVQDVIEIGQVLEKFYNGSAGKVFRAMVNGRIKEQLSALDDNDTAASRRLGRAEGIQLIQDDIEIAIEQMKQLTTSKGE